MDPFSSDNKLLFDQTLDTKTKLKLTKRTQSRIQLEQNKIVSFWTKMVKLQFEHQMNDLTILVALKRR